MSQPSCSPARPIAASTARQLAARGCAAAALEFRIAFAGAAVDIGDRLTDRDFAAARAGDAFAPRAVGFAHAHADLRLRPATTRTSPAPAAQSTRAMHASIAGISSGSTDAQVGRCAFIDAAPRAALIGDAFEQHVRHVSAARRRSRCRLAA